MDTGEPLTHAQIEGRQRGRFVRSLLAVGLIYGNVAALNAQFAANYQAVPALPVIDILLDPFFLFGMFDSYETDARELVVEGRHNGAWVRLQASDFFPGTAADRQIWAQGVRKLGELLPGAAILRERARLLVRVRDRQNRLHPQQMVDRIRVGHLSWPKSIEGHEARRTRGQERFELWYEGP